MPMTLSAAQRILQQVSAMPQQQEPTPAPSGPRRPGGTPGSGGTTTTPTTQDPREIAHRAAQETSIDNAVYRINNGTYSASDVQAVKEAGLITPTQAARLLDFVSPSGTGSGGFGGSSGGGGFDTGPGYLSLANQQFASSEEQRAIENAIMWQQLLNSQKYADRTYEMDVRGQDASILGDRASSGGQTANLARGLANDQYERANSPANFPAYLAALAGADTGGNPLNSLLGEGFRIESGEGQNPLTDPRFQSLYNSLLTYGTVPDPAGVSAVRDEYNRNPNAAQGFANMQAFEDAKPMAFGGSLTVGNDPVQPYGGPAPTGAPTGGDFSLPRTGGSYGGGSTLGLPKDWGASLMKMVNGGGGMQMPTSQQPYPLPHLTTPNPVSINDMGTGKPLAVAGEAGSENISVSPNTYDPAQGTAVSLGQALKPLGFIPPQIIQQLLSGQTVSPNMFNEEQLRRLPPSLRQLLQASIRSMVGQTGLEDFAASQEQFALPGMGGYSRVSH